MENLRNPAFPEVSNRLAADNLKPVENRILDATLERMNQKGYAGCTIREIAKIAKVTEPTIYQYFKSKEDLLFSAVERQAQHMIAFQYEQTLGIAGAYNKLRKLVWAHLRYNDLYREYITLVLLECRANSKFYSSTAYNIFRHYSGTYLSILQEGMDEGVFREDLDPRLIRDLILGLLDFEAYTVLVTQEIEVAAPDHPHIMSLLERIILKRPQNELSQTKKREKLLEVAIQLFSEKDYARVTIAEIAKRAGISEGTVYEYFENKEDLLLTIPEERFRTHLEELSDTFDIRDSSRKLRRFVRNHFRLYLDDRQFLVIYLLMIQLNRRFYQSRAYKSLRSYIEVFENIVKEGIQDGSFVPDCNVRVFRNMFWGVFTHMCLRWFIVDKTPKDDKFSEISRITFYLLAAVTETATVKGV